MGKLKRGNWSTHELERLRSLYPKSSEESVARLLRRSVPSVHRKARQIVRTVLDRDNFPLPQIPNDFYYDGFAQWMLGNRERSDYDFDRSGFSVRRNIGG